MGRAGGALQGDVHRLRPTGSARGHAEEEVAGADVEGHPVGGDLLDHVVAGQVVEAGRDHVVVGHGATVSMAERGLL